MKIVIVCGGPSLERGISLNSARSLLDHLDAGKISVLYVDQQLQFFVIPSSQLYCNTTSDFDFKIHKDNPLTEASLISFLRQHDIVFPVIHGTFGEDGSIQKLFQKYHIPYVGSNSSVCAEVFDKINVKTNLKNLNYNVAESILITSIDQNDINKFLVKYPIAVLKPRCYGSSIGVFKVHNINEVIKKVHYIQKYIFPEVILEEYLEGDEFTVTVIKNRKTIALPPSQIEIIDQDKIFDYRKKYLPTAHTKYHCPPLFNIDIIQNIQRIAKILFEYFRMNDFARFDGWLLKNGDIIFNDINPISGLEQNSFLFQQAAVAGFTHKEILNIIVKNACYRNNITYQEIIHTNDNKKQINVLFGGINSERQVSVMSGSNVWLKLLNSTKFKPEAFFLGPNKRIFHLTYPHILFHTVEEIYANYNGTGQSLEEFINSSEFVFLALHGDIGEDGTIQKMLEDAGVKFNGSDSQTSQLCINKYLTLEAINIEGVIKNNIRFIDQNNYISVYNDIGPEIVIKPINDGCSTGVARIACLRDLKIYMQAISSKAVYIPSDTLLKDKRRIELSGRALMAETFILCDEIKIDNYQVVIKKHHGWVELTGGILEKDGVYTAFSPSITIAEDNILSLEEKFQGGTGINLTPPPEEIITSTQLSFIQNKLAEVAAQLKIKNYCRIDFFFNRIYDKIIIIEVNTLPALTPSTVLYHQALHENITPLELLELIIENANV